MEERLVRRRNSTQFNWRMLRKMEAILLFYMHNREVLPKKDKEQLRKEYEIAHANSPFRFIKFRRGVTP